MADSKEFSERQGRELGMYLMEFFHKRLPAQYQSIEWWENNLTVQANFISEEVQGMMAKRYGSFDKAVCLKYNIDQGDPLYWLRMYQAYLSELEENGSTQYEQKWEQNCHNDAALFSEVQRIMSAYNYNVHDLKKPVMGDITDSHIKTYFLMQSDRDGYIITPENHGLWKREDIYTTHFSSLDWSDVKKKN